MASTWKLAKLKLLLLAELWANNASSATQQICSVVRLVVLLVRFYKSRHNLRIADSI